MNKFLFKFCMAGMTTLVTSFAMAPLAMAQAPNEEKNGETVIQPETLTVEKPKIVYELFCSNCRSIFYQATFNHIDEVNEAAREAGEKWRNVLVKSTDLVEENRGQYTSSQTISYRVFAGQELRCRKIAWTLKSEHASRMEAAAAAKAMQDSNALLQVVQHHSQDVKVAAKK